MTILELRTKRAKAWESAKSFLDSHRTEKGTLSAEDDATYTRMEQDITDLGKEIARLERQEAFEAELKKPLTNPLTGKPNTGSETKTGRASDDYNDAFNSFVRGLPILHNVMEVGTDANGGYLVPTEYENKIIQGLRENNVMRQLCKVITTESERKIPVAASHTTAVWTAENAAYTESNPSFSQISIDAFKLTDLIKVSQELLQDSAFDIAAYIAEEIAYAFGGAEEEAFCVGTGGTQPTGVFTANGGQVGVTTGSAATVTSDELITLIYSLKSPYRKNAKFLMNDTTVSLLRKLKDGNGAYMWQPSMQAGEPDKLNGYPLYTSAYAPTITTDALAIGFGDFSHYWIADRSGRTIQRLNELFAGNGQVGFVASERVDGKTILPEAIKLLKMKNS